MRIGTMGDGEDAGGGGSGWGDFAKNLLSTATVITGQHAQVDIAKSRSTSPFSTPLYPGAGYSPFPSSGLGAGGILLIGGAALLALLLITRKGK